MIHIGDVVEDFTERIVDGLGEIDGSEGGHRWRIVAWIYPGVMNEILTAFVSAVHQPANHRPRFGLGDGR